MKLTDLCIVFVMLFICLVLPGELRIKDDREKIYSKIQFDRTMDRLVSDATEDVVTDESVGGRPVVDREKINENFDRLLSLAFDAEDTSDLLRNSLLQKFQSLLVSLRLFSRKLNQLNLHLLRLHLRKNLRLLQSI